MEGKCQFKCIDASKKVVNKNKKKFPNRWLNYDSVGRDIPGARIVAFKTPLSYSFFEDGKDKDNNRFEVQTLLKYAAGVGKSIGLVIDLTNTNRYYDHTIWLNNNVEYVKIRCPGRKIHCSQSLVNQFLNSVNDFFSRNAENDKIVGVHCTHGLNRTGYLVCTYLISSMGWPAKKAIEEFELYRGHKIERKSYIESLYKLEIKSVKSNIIANDAPFSETNKMASNQETTE